MTKFTMHPCLCIDYARQIYQVIGAHRPIVHHVFECAPSQHSEIPFHGIVPSDKNPPMATWATIDDYLVILGSQPTNRILASGEAPLVKRLYPGIDWREMLK